jgi:hypothetical protein
VVSAPSVESRTFVSADTVFLPAAADAADPSQPLFLRPVYAAAAPGRASCNADVMVTRPGRRLVHHTPCWAANPGARTAPGERARGGSVRAGVIAVACT